MSAAVADYRIADVAEKKIKREHTDAPPQLQLKKNPDIAATLGAQKRSGQILVGFALETDNEETNALEKLHRKNLDLIVLNSLNDKGAGFGTDTNRITIFDNGGASRTFPLKPKSEVATDILAAISQHAQQQNK